MSEIYEAGNDQILQEDLVHVAKSNVRWEKLENSTILVTGATGLVGSLLVRALLCADRLDGRGIKVKALVRSREKAAQIFGELANREELTFIEADLMNGFSEAIEGESFDYAVHTASITASRLMVTKPVETIMTAVQGTEAILKAACSAEAKGVVYLSSMEVYGSFSGTDGACVTEEMMGYVDPLVIRSNYPLAKRMCENLCAAYASEYGLPVKIARLAQTFGAGVLPGENRVFAQFARSAMRHEEIVLHTKGMSEGNYCYTADALKAILLLLTEGENGQAYNVSNEETHTTIAAMAELVCREFSDGKSRVVFDIPENNVFGYAAETHMKLSSEKLRGLGWEPEVGLVEAYRRMNATLKLLAM